jgi:hypothetical protein
VIEGGTLVPLPSLYYYFSLLLHYYFFFLVIFFLPVLLCFKLNYSVRLLLICIYSLHFSADKNKCDNAMILDNIIFVYRILYVLETIHVLCVRTIYSSVLDVFWDAILYILFLM